MADFLLGAADVSNHLLPHFGAVVGTVDAGEIHAGAGEIEDHVVIVGGLGGQGHHDERRRIVRRGAEQQLRVLLEEIVGLGHLIRYIRILIFNVFMHSATHNIVGRHDTGADARLRGGQTRGTHARQRRLELRVVMCTQVGVIKDVLGPLLVTRVHLVDLVLVLRSVFRHAVEQRFQITEQILHTPIFH